MVQSEINLAIGNKSPKEYFTQPRQRCAGGKLKYGGICDADELKANSKMNCIPDGMETRELEHYNDFLEERRKLITTRIREYYFSLQVDLLVDGKTNFLSFDFFGSVPFLSWRIRSRRTETGSSLGSCGRRFPAEVCA